LQELTKSALAQLKARRHLQLTLSQQTKMKFALIGAAAIAAAAFATPALAQAVIEDPGYCAQYYPNANCQNYGPGNPYTDGSYHRNDWRNGNASMEHRVHRQHRTHHG
jgi:hypothetical protein